MGEVQLLIDVTKELQNKLDTSMQNILWNKRSIYKVPASVTALNKAAYRPQTVSFGPYHYCDDQLKRMEEHKHRALHYFLKRSGKSLELFLQSLNEVVQDLKDSYDQLDKSWKDDTSKFLQLMILDGCFMVEIMRLAIQPSNDYATDDPIFSSHGRVYTVPFIKRDMLIVENQLPMLVLYKLVAVESNGTKDEESVNKLVLAFCNDPDAGVLMLGKCLHVLDLYRKSLIQKDPNRKRHQTRVRGGLHKDVNDIVRSAAEINEAGIRFKKRNEVTSYVFFMDNLIDNERDVSLLHSRGIIQNAIGSDKAVAKLFNSLSKDIALDPDTFTCWDILEERNVLQYEGSFHYSLGLLHVESWNRASSLQLEAMEEEKQVLIKVVTEELQNMANTSMKNVVRSKRSIYRIPASVTAHNKTAYMPQTVSFGPYHHDDIHLKPMEEHKQRALGFFLQKTGIPLQSVVESLNDEMQVLKDSYDMLDESWKNDNKFLQLMILDGCFMLEIIRLAKPNSPGYSADDPVFSSHGRLYMIPHIRRDMLLLENQLPMLVLYRLVAVESDGAKDEESVNELIRNFIHPGASASSLGKCLHVLDLYRKSLLQRDPIKKKRRPREKGGLPGDDNDIIRSATEINEAGIQFKKSKSNEVTSYVFFMDSIIDNERDVALLNSRGIVLNAIGSDKAVAKLFNSLSKDIALESNSNLQVVQMHVNAYCKKPWNAWRANLIHTYFRNPWAILSVIAALILFALTIAQTIYSILPYYNSNNSKSLSPPMIFAAPPPLSTPPPPMHPPKPSRRH
ncbi:hypothetical protein D5086_007245 [Populus alba]|uniref:Uncharacterized protein n=1 Tax=Populus alba TaxID=43335 RepID=A0ACC4CN08_POPAL